MERISYGMPFYEYGGKGYQGRLVYFAAFKKHISVFLPYGGPLPKELARQIDKYHAGKATYRFPLDQPFPVGLIGRVVKALVKEHPVRGVCQLAYGGDSLSGMTSPVVRSKAGPLRRLFVTPHQETP